MRISSPEPRIIRFYPEARTAHLERAKEMETAKTYFLKKRSDFDETLAALRPDFEKTTLGALIRKVLADPPDILEIPEPMWFQYFPHTLLLTTALRTLRPSASKRTRIVSYAIENATLDRVPRPLSRLPPVIWRVAARAALRVSIRNLDRLAFGTTGARTTLLASLPSKGRHKIESLSRVIEATPSPCECVIAEPSERLSGSLLFVGALEQRKGVDILLNVWPLVRGITPSATLVIAGSGALEAQVRRLANSDASVTYLPDLPRTEIHRLYRKASVVALLSQGQGRWREQVGLPLVEAAAHGCRIVATSETGLAEWLRSRGQTVVDVPSSLSEISRAIAEQLNTSATPSPDYQLDPRDGRLRADAWLMSITDTS